jgi:hypothetical protein
MRPAHSWRGMQYRVNTEEWIDVPGGYAHPCELLGEP